MKTITFYSYKGGVGRSLALSNVANRLAEFGKRVCILDFDLEAPGLHLKFGEYISSQGVSSGLVDYIDSFSRSGEVPSDINDYITWISFEKSDQRQPIALIAAGNTRSRQYWNKVCAIDWKRFFYDEKSVGVEFFYNLKEQVRAQINPDFLLIDSRTGITDISGVTMSIMADEVVLLGANNQENLEGITQIIKTLAVPENSIHNKIPKINFVLSRIPYFQNPKDKPKETNAKNTALWHINKDLIDSGYGHFQLEKVLVIHSDPELEMKETFKIGHQSDPEKENERSVIGLDYLALFEEITAGMITDQERKAFDYFMKVESLIQKAKATSELSSRIKLLHSAIELNLKSGTAYSELALAHFGLKEYGKAIQYFEQAIELEPATETKYRFHRGICYLELRDCDRALKLFLAMERLIPDEPILLNQISRTYYLQGQYNDALDFARRSIDHDGESLEGWNLYANTLRVMGKYDEAMDAVYKALEIHPQSTDATGTLAEINAALDNDREFYKNLELSFTFGMESYRFQMILEEEPIYRRYYGQSKFLEILDKYEIEIDWEKVFSRN
jgi:tetratricopeptide (TPR) repeat protein